MKKFLKVFSVILGVLLVAGVSAYFIWFHNTEEHTLKLDPKEVYATQNSPRYLITNANVVDVESGTILENKHLTVRNGIVARIFEGSIHDSLRENYTIVNAENRFLMPGMIDMHAHLNSGGLIPPDESTRPMALEQFARYGVSTIFTLGGHGFNQEITADLIDKQKSNELIGPQIFATGDILTAPGGYPIPLVPMMTGIPADEIDLDEQGILTVSEESDFDAIFSKKKELGLNGIKIMVESGLGGASEEPRISDATLQKIVQIASEYNLSVFAHVSRQDDLEDAIHAGVDVIVHTVADQVLKDAETLFEKMKEDSIYYTPTLSIAYMYQYVASAEILEDPFLMQYSSERTNRSLENWPVRQLMVQSSGVDTDQHKQNMMQNFSLFYKAGVPILMGSDAGNPSVIPGYSAHKELEFMSDGGMSNAEVLRAATIIPAQFLGVDDITGSIGIGKMASFIMLDDNPLKDVRNSRSIHRVMLEGYWIE
ncbi:amidohydrolase family protein [Balneolaceae bacterium YR4-1]|uniref:Amidohydrolase family protein n=1 Tax=Halalkalibaculum roseum TaxID=2709311 RepID=A0A6M1SLU0_9BACT|nr:amidohydrolase family protein [Halalkalibaculum roseum]NGP76301.1 amidohydrolase family protein [Halalkalibaculum roseum]